MRNTLKVTKYQILGLKMLSQTIICFSIILFNILISITISRFINRLNDVKAEVSIGSIDSVALVWIFIVGLCCFKDSFRLLLSLGVSRKRFFKANVIALAMMAVVWSIAVTLFAMIGSRITKINILFYQLYNDMSFFSTVIWSIAAFLMLAMLGWFVNMSYYRSGKWVKLIISVLPLVLSGLLIAIDLLVNGIIFKAVFRFLITIMGFSTKTPNPYIGAASLFILSIIICGFNFLLIRKAQIKS